MAIFNIASYIYNLALSRCISALKPDSSQADIQRPRANIGFDIKIAMHFIEMALLELISDTVFKTR